MSEHLSISEVAKRSNLSRVTIYKLIEKGELSVVVNPVNQTKAVEKSEFIRFITVRGVKSLQSTNSKSEQVLTVNSDNDLQAKVNSLQALLDAKDKLIEAKEQVIEEQAKRLLLLEDRSGLAVTEQEKASVAATSAPTPAPVTKPTKPERGIASRLIGAVMKELTR